MAAPGCVYAVRGYFKPHLMYNDRKITASNKED